ncbi:MAG: hypothetical protein JWM98_585 [Thermoleophilia bacterium]|nr:hypothetical protein [Thermoleophilia bacterium]
MIRHLVHAPRRARTAGVAALLVLVASAAVAQAAMPARSLRGPQRISGQFSRGPVLAAAADGRAVAAWTQIGAAHTIVTSDLKLGGWTSPVPLAGSEDAEDPVVATSPRGNTVVAWLIQHGNRRSGAIGVSYRPVGGVFGPVRFLGSIAGGADNADVAVAVNDAGRTVATWNHVDDSRSVHAAFGVRGAWAGEQTLAGGTGDITASGARVAVDAAGRAIVIYEREATNVSGSATIEQAIAGAVGVFGGSTTLQANAFSEHGVDNNPTVRTNAAGQVVAGWGAICATDCPELFFWKFGMGTTSTGITSSKQVSNPGGGDITAGPDRKAGGISEVAIDEAGNGTMVWDATVAGLATDYDYWAAHVTPAGDFSASSIIGTNSGAVSGEMRVAAADGRVLVSWVAAGEVGAPTSVVMTQAAHPGSAVASWTAPVAVSAARVGTSSPSLVLAPNGIATVSYLVADRVWSNTTAARDRSRPTLGLPRADVTVRVIRGGFRLPMSCPRTEAECLTSMIVTAAPDGAVTTRVSSVIAGGSTQRVAFRLTARGRARLAQGRFRVLVTARVSDDSGNTRTLRRSVWLQG